MLIGQESNKILNTQRVMITTVVCLSVGLVLFLLGYNVGKIRGREELRAAIDQQLAERRTKRLEELVSSGKS
jgi:hypothetical protein